MSFPDPPAPRYRMDLQIRGGRLLVNLDGPAGPDADRHLNEVRAAAAKCDLDVVVHYVRPDPTSPRPSLRRSL